MTATASRSSAAPGSVVCPKCEARLPLLVKHLPAHGAGIRCNHCEHSFFCRPPSRPGATGDHRAATPSPPASPSPPPAPPVRDPPRHVRAPEAAGVTPAAGNGRPPPYDTTPSLRGQAVVGGPRRRTPSPEVPSPTPEGAAQLPELPELPPGPAPLAPLPAGEEAERVAALEDLSSIDLSPAPPPRRVWRLLALGVAAVVIFGGGVLAALTLLGEGGGRPERRAPAPPAVPPPAAPEEPALLAVDLPTTAFGVPPGEGVAIRLNAAQVQVAGQGELEVSDGTLAAGALQAAADGQAVHLLVDAGVPYSTLSTVAATLGGPGTELLLAAAPAGASRGSTGYRVLPVRLGAAVDPEADLRRMHAEVRVKAKAKRASKGARRRLEAAVPALVQELRTCLRRQAGLQATGKLKLKVRFGAAGIPEAVEPLGEAPPPPCLAEVLSKWDLSRAAAAAAAGWRSRMKVKTKLKVKTSKGFEPIDDDGPAAAAQERIAGCLGEHLSKKAKGKLGFTVRFDPAGQRTVELTRDPLPDGPAGPCVTEALQAWDFGRPPPDKPSKVKVAVAFKVGPRKAPKVPRKSDEPFSAKVAVAWEVRPATAEELAPAPGEAAELRIALLEGGYRVTPPLEEPFEIPKVADYYKAPTLAQRLIDGREGFPAGMRISVEPDADIGYASVVDLVGALRRPVEGAPAFPPVTLRPPSGG